MLAERGQRLDEAVDLVQRALKLEPGNPSFLDSLGWAYYQQGKLDLADPPLTEAAVKLPNNSVIQDHLGDLRFKQQRFADAAAAWERALNGDGESIDRTAIEKKIVRTPDRVWRTAVGDAAPRPLDAGASRASLSLATVALRRAQPKRVDLLPSGPATPFADAARAYAAGGQGVPRRANDSAPRSGCRAAPARRRFAATSTPASRRRTSIRLEGRHPLGRPVFILVARRARRSTLYMPRDNRVLRERRSADIVEALVGVEARRPTSCGRSSAAAGSASASRPTGGGTATVAAVTVGGTTTYLRQEQGQWRVGRPRRARAPLTRALLGHSPAAAPTTLRVAGRGARRRPM